MPARASVTPRARRAAPSVRAPRPKVGFVSLCCAKALVDSENILTQLRAEGYDTAPTYDGASHSTTSPGSQKTRVTRSTAC